MQASELISSSIESIHPMENGKRAVQMMDQFRINHLAIGSDYCGNIRPPKDLKEITYLQNLTKALRNVGFTEQEINKVLAENLFRLFR